MVELAIELLRWVILAETLIVIWALRHVFWKARL